MGRGAASQGAACKGVLAGVAAALAVLFVSSETFAALSFPAINERVIDRYVVPRFEALASATRKLADDLPRVCRGEPRTMRVARKDFDAAVLAWAAVEFLRFGPMSTVGRPERFAFWPDPRGIGQRQLAVLIAKRDAAVLAPGVLAKKSAAVQGLTALETLLTDDKISITDDGEDAHYRCQLAVAIARSLDASAHDVLSEWSGAQDWRRKFLEAGEQNTNYKTPNEAAGDFARALITGLQLIQDRQVAPMSAAVATPDKPARLPFARSKLSARYISAGLASLQDLYKAMDLASAAPSDKAWMPRSIDVAFERLVRDAPAAVEDSARPSDESPEERTRKLRILRFHVESIRKLVGRELAPAAGLTIGFNELDGD
jgi:predicted lipoprotein